MWREWSASSTSKSILCDLSKPVRLLAEAALEQLEFSVAEKAFVRFEDYQVRKDIPEDIPVKKYLPVRKFQRKGIPVQ